jgi:hypothetical protein
MKEEFEDRVGFAIGTGRCGTHFIVEVLKLERDVSAVHERNPLNETFHRYCKWYKLPVDDEGFLHAKELEIRQDLTRFRFSFEGSAHLSLSIKELYERFGAKFLLLTRSPERMVNSYLDKGLYDQPFVKGNLHLALGYQACKQFHHFLGRIAPGGQEFSHWNEMSQVGKLAWFWQAINANVLNQFGNLPETHWRVAKIESLTYERYLEIAQFLGIQTALTRETYDNVAKRLPGGHFSVPTVADWNANEIAEFETQVASTAQKLGYEYRVDRLPVPSARPAASGTRWKFLPIFRMKTPQNQADWKAGTKPSAGGGSPNTSPMRSRRSKT